MGVVSEKYKEWLTRITLQREQWLGSYPEGVSYNVRVLDGGAWDRSTNKGTFDNFEKALEVAKKLYEEKV